jgi:hypothetical protein
MAGHTFATNHDVVVDNLTAAGVPDVLANVPSMGPVYAVSVSMEMAIWKVRVYKTTKGSNKAQPFIHEHPKLLEKSKK